MSGFFDIYSIIFLVIAVVIFMRLGSVLGRRTGNEPTTFEPRVKRRLLRPQRQCRHLALTRARTHPVSRCAQPGSADPPCHSWDAAP
jgi:predicted lipid-binding transport protein (Tim44 family)